MYLECKFDNGEVRTWQEDSVGGIDGLIKVYIDLMAKHNSNKQVMLSRKFISSSFVCLPVAPEGFCIKSRDGSRIKKQYRRLKYALRFMKNEETPTHY